MLTPKTLELLNTYQDTRKFMYQLCAYLGTTDSAIVAGGFARRMYMLQNDIEINENDYYGDVDIFISLESIVDALDNTKYHEVMNLLGNPKEAEEARVVVSDIYHKFINRFIIPTLVDNTSSLTTWAMNKFSDENKIKPLTFNSNTFTGLLPSYVGAMLNEKVVFEHLANQKQSLIDSNTGKMVISLNDAVQLIIMPADDIQEIVESFDIDQSKFMMAYPFEDATYIGTHDILDDIYTIDHPSKEQVGSITKALYRYIKYSQYGFRFSSSFVSDIMRRIDEMDNSTLADLTFYKNNGEFYV